MVTERLTGADSTGEGGGRSAMLPAPILRVRIVAVVAAMAVQMAGGTRGIGGCTFCNNEGFTPSYLREQRNIHQQIDTGIAFMRRRYPNTRAFLAYFQSYSNTYGELDRLKAIYDAALKHPDISGIVVGTRPDCLPNETLDYLAAQVHEWVELADSGELDAEEMLSRLDRWTEEMDGHKNTCIRVREMLSDQAWAIRRATGL